MNRSAVREPGTNLARFLVGGVLTFGCASCRAPASDGFGCTGDAIPGILIRVRDGNTLAPAAHGVRGVVQDGEYSDSLRVTRWIGSVDSANAIGVSAARERVGRYTVHMERDGYQSWDTAGILVTRGMCHVVTAELNVNLQPLQ